MEDRILELIKKHIDDFDRCPPGQEYYYKLLHEVVKEGCTAIEELIKIFDKANIDTVILKKQFDEKYAIDGDAIFHKDKTELIRFDPCSALKEYEISCYVCSEAFVGCAVEKIIVRNNVKTMGSKVFKNCMNLIEAIFENGETKLDNDCFVGCTDNLVIKAPAGGYVEEYAKKYNIKFEATK